MQQEGDLKTKQLKHSTWFTLNVIGSKNDPIESIAEQIDQSVNEHWISKGISPSLKTNTKKTVAGVIKSLKNLSVAHKFPCAKKTVFRVTVIKLPSCSYI